MEKLKKLFRHNELYISIVIILIMFGIEIRSGQFFTSNNIVDLLAAMIVPGLFAVGAFLVLVSGGIDVSFPALASLSMYGTTKLLIDMNYSGGIIFPLLLALIFGGCLGVVNGWLIAKYRLQPLIVTLGTASVFRGVMQGVLNSVQLPVIPQSMASFGTSALFYAKNSVTGFTSRMPVAFILFLLVIVLVYVLLHYTMFGRGLYAIGGNETSALRAGFNVVRIKIMLYILVGMISSIAGFVRVCMMGQMHPTNMIGMEMMIIAGVVLGGVSITGGAGTLLGCILGTSLIVIVQNSLILLGIPTFWQSFFLGLLIILGTGITALKVQKSHSLKHNKKV